MAKKEKKFDLEVEFKKFVGKKWEEDVNKGDILSLEGVKEVRVLYPDSQMTLDFRPDRANVFLNFDDEITEVSLG